MQPAEVADDVDAGADEEVVGIAEDDLRAEFAQLGGGDGFHRGLRADGHEDRGLDGAVRGGEAAPAREGGGVGVEEVEHGWRVKREALKREA